MTRADLYDWIRAYDCEVQPLKETTTGSAVKLINPKTNAHAYMDMPIDERPVKHFAACKICILLGIPIPDECAYMKQLHDHIENKHSKGK